MLANAIENFLLIGFVIVWTNLEDINDVEEDKFHNFDEIKQNFSKFEDEKIEHIAKCEVGGLQPEVIDILINEIKSRSLNLNLIKGIKAQTSELTESELNEVIHKISSLICPECRLNNGQLVGSIVRTVNSAEMPLPSFSTFYVISCKSCADKIKKKAFTDTFIYGFWGICGIFRTPISLIKTLLDNRKSDVISNNLITRFALDNIGEIKTKWDNEEELVDFLGCVNNQSR